MFLCMCMCVLLYKTCYDIEYKITFLWWFLLLYERKTVIIQRQHQRLSLPFIYQLQWYNHLCETLLPPVSCLLSPVPPKDTSPHMDPILPRPSTDPTGNSCWHIPEPNRTEQHHHSNTTCVTRQLPAASNGPVPVSTIYAARSGLSHCSRARSFEICVFFLDVSRTPRKFRGSTAQCERTLATYGDTQVSREVAVSGLLVPGGCISWLIDGWKDGRMEGWKDGRKIWHIWSWHALVETIYQWVLLSIYQRFHNDWSLFVVTVDWGKHPVFISTILSLTLFFFCCLCHNRLVATGIFTLAVVE